MIKVPLELVEIEGNGCHLLVEATIGEELVMLVLDTGASRTVIDKGFLESQFQEIQLNAEETSSAGVGSIDLESFTTQLKGVQIGVLMIPELEAAVIDLSQLIDFYELKVSKKIAGVLGGDILLKGNAVIDYARLELLLSKHELAMDN